MKRFFLFALFAALVLQSSHAGGNKKSPFKPVIPADAYAALTARSIQTIETLAASDVKDAAERIEFEAAIVTGYTLSVKNSEADDVAKLRGAALLAVQAARNRDLKKLAAFGKSIAAAPKTPPDLAPRKAYLQDLQWMMETFRNQKKGGEGIHAELQYQVKLKNLNGIEALIGALSAKKLSDVNLAKVEKELPLLSFRMAVIGAITHEFAPDKGAAEWRDLSNQMRDASLALAEAAKKKDAEGIVKAATTLETSCTKCHSAFRKN